MAAPVAFVAAPFGEPLPLQLADDGDHRRLVQPQPVGQRAGSPARPLLAQGLTRAGVDVTVYERDAGDRAGPGYRIHIAPHGDEALWVCLPPALYERVVDTAGIRGSGVRVLDPRLNVVHETLVGGDGHHTVDRLTLRRILLTGIHVRYATAFGRALRAGT